MKPVLHLILDNAPLWAEQHAKQWEKYADVKRWDWAGIRSVIGKPFREFEKTKAGQDPRFRANFARHWLVFLSGGAYADWDTEPVSNPFRPDEWSGKFAIAPHPTMIPWTDNCFFWTDKPEHPTAKRILDNVDWSRLAARQIMRVTAQDPLRLRLGPAWNCHRSARVEIIRHYYNGASLNRGEMEWLLPQIEGAKVAESGSGLRSIEINEVCDLVSVEHDEFFSSRVRRGGVTVDLVDLDQYPAQFANHAAGADFLLIDGRRRVACLEAAAETTKPGTVAFLHDSKRTRYNVPSGWKISATCPGSKRGLIALQKV